MDPQTITFNTSENLDPNEFTRTGYTFDGWNTESGGGGTSYTDEEEFTMDVEGITLYAQWLLTTGQPTVFTNITTGIEETNATLHGYLSDNGSADTTCYFLYDTSTPPTSNNQSQGTIANQTEFSYNATSLTQGKHYYYDTKANNSAGWDNTGGILQFMTKPETLTDFTATVDSGTQITLTWADGTGGDGAYIEYSTGSAPTPWNPGDGTKIDADGNVTTPHIHTVSTGTHYYYKAWAIATDAGWTSSGNTTSPRGDTPKTTDATTPTTPTVITNTSTGVEENNATLKGYLSSDGDDACTLGFRYDTDSGTPYSQNYSIVGTHNTGTEFSNNNESLTSGDLYYYQAWANNTAGFANGSELTFFTKPPAVTSLSESSSTNTSISYSWTEASVGSGATAKTHIRYQKGSPPSSVSEGLEAQNDTDESETTTSLDPGTQYNFSAFSWGEEDAKGNWNDTYVTFSAWTNPGDPTGISYSKKDIRYINLSFTHGTNGSHTMIRRNASGVADYPADRDSGVLIDNTTNSYVNDTGLNESTTYYYSFWTYDTDSGKWCDNKIDYSVSTNTNNPPVFSNENPENESTTSTSFTWNITIEDPDAHTFNWTIECENGQSNSGNDETNGSKTLSISGLEFSTTYKLWVNATDSYDWTREWFEFTTSSNNPPVLSGENPSNTSTVVSTLLSTINITIEDPDGNQINWTIETSPDIGSQDNSSSSEANGSKICSISGLSPATTYTWFVNATDGYSWTNETYTFTTNQAPTQTGESPPNSTTDTELTPQLYVICNDADGDQLNATWWNNWSGAWQQFGSNETSFASGTNITQPNTNFSDYGTKYYWSVNLSDGELWNNQTYHFTTRNKYIPGEPTSFKATTINRTKIELSWAKGTNADKTYIRYKQGSSPPTDREDGTFLYNDTGESRNVTGLSFGTQYSFKAWSWNDTDSCYSTNNATAENTTDSNQAPVLSGETPTNQSGSIPKTTSTINITIEDPDGDQLNWTIETSPDIGSQDNSSSSEANGSKICSVSGPVSYTHLRAHET